MKKWIKENSLSIVFLALFVFSMVGQIGAGIKEYNKEREEYGLPAASLSQYLGSGHFIEATFENWESEFLQMALFVVLTISLKQKGSSESKEFNRTNDVDEEPDPTMEDAPWPVKRGGVYLWIYKRSLSIALFALFIASFVLHLYGSLKAENAELAMKGKPAEEMSSFIVDSKFWFESFQNWQSEFLSVFAIVFLSIYLRQFGSPQSKPVDAPNAQTGE